LIEVTSDTWVTIEKWALIEIERSRDNLEKGNSDIERGRIDALREILALAKPVGVQTVVVDYSD
tara:strand:- start:2131 stop:2322 length:192 start_codon:yes stop_codon:yes gene_type:complete